MNNTKPYILFLLSISLMMACAKKVPLTDTVQKNERLYHQSVPFSGIAYSSYSNGNPYMEEEYKNGLRHGYKMIWYLNGEKKLKEEYQEGQLHGKRIEYFESGKIKTETTFSEGIESGEYIEYFENGKKKLVVDRSSHKTFYNN
tara:strand:+ start:7567 stop:7998 length:432 start_codon:yes stop_codon:yes gene_type:complete